MTTRTKMLGKKRGMSFGKHYILIGLSIILGIVSSKLILYYDESFTKSISIISTIEMSLLLFALIFLFEGIYFLSVAEPTKIKFYIFWPYMVVFTVVGSLYLRLADIGSFGALNKWYLYTLMTILWFAVLFELFKLIVAFKNILKLRVTESKDRLSIILTLLGTLIATIALFK